MEWGEFSDCSSLIEFIIQFLWVILFGYSIGVILCSITLFKVMTCCLCASSPSRRISYLSCVLMIFESGLSSCRSWRTLHLLLLILWFKYSTNISMHSLNILWFEFFKLYIYIWVLKRNLRNLKKIKEYFENIFT